MKKTKAQGVLLPLLLLWLMPNSILLGWICNPPAVSIRICYPKKLQEANYRIADAYTQHERIANPTERDCG